MIVQIAKWTLKSTELIEKVRNLLDSANIKYSSLPKNIYVDDKPINLVFAGQYSAGKSSILKMLTGRQDIGVGEGITTQQTHTYNWNGVNVIDTPGIHTTLRPDHDEITYAAIANADLLVFVITNELFDSYLAQHFHKLAIEREKADEMILVVNKIERGGNTQERQDIIREDLRKVTAPYTPEDMCISFVSAESYIDSLTEEDKEIAEELLERSGYKRFIETMNNFIQEKNIPARLTPALYKIDEVLQDGIKQLQPSSGDRDIDALEERYLQERHILTDNRRRIEQSVENIYTEATANIRNEGIKSSNLIVSDAKEDNAQAGLEKATQKVDSIAKQCEFDVQEKIKSLVGECDSELEQLNNSEFSKKLDIRLLEKKDSLPPQIKNFLKSDALNNAGKFVAENAYRPGVATNATKLASFSESTVHSAVKTIGHFFGHKFKPWEAVKITKGIAVAGKALSILGVVFSVGMQVKEDIDAQQVEAEMRSNRENIRSGFNDAARELEKHFVNALRNFIEAEFDSRISQVDEKIDEIRSLRENKSENCLRLEAVLKENRQLIREIHKANG